MRTLPFLTADMVILTILWTIKKGGGVPTTLSIALLPKSLAQQTQCFTLKSHSVRHSLQ